MPDQTTGINQTSLDVFHFQPGVALQQQFRRVSGSEHPQHMLYPKATAANDGLTAKDVRIQRDPFKKFLFRPSFVPSSVSGGPYSSCEIKACNVRFGQDFQLADSMPLI